MENDGPTIQRDGNPAPDQDAASEGGSGSSHRRPPLRILGLDAGNTTGFALYDSGNLVQGQTKNTTYPSDFRRDRRPTYTFLAECGHLDAIGYEWFIARQAMKEDHLDVMYINGAVEAEASRRDIPWHRYTPAQSKRRISDDLLKEMGWWPGFGLRTGGHAADATRVLLCIMTDHYPLELARLA